MKKTDFLKHCKELSNIEQGMNLERAERTARLKAFKGDGGNPRTLQMARKLLALDAAKANDFRADLDTYCDWLGVGAQSEAFKSDEMRKAPKENGERPEA